MKFPLEDNFSVYRDPMDYTLLNSEVVTKT